MENLHLGFFFGLFTACDMQDFTLSSYNVKLQVVFTIDVSTLENILWSYLAHLGRMRRTTTTTAYDRNYDKDIDTTTNRSACRSINLQVQVQVQVQV